MKDNDVKNGLREGVEGKKEKESSSTMSLW